MTRSRKLKNFTEKHITYVRYKYPDKKVSWNVIHYHKNKTAINNSKKTYFKLPYIRTFSNANKIKLKQTSDKYSKNINNVVAFSPLKSNLSKPVKSVAKSLIL